MYPCELVGGSKIP